MRAKTEGINIFSDLLSKKASTNKKPLKRFLFQLAAINTGINPGVNENP